MNDASSIRLLQPHYFLLEIGFQPKEAETFTILYDKGAIPQQLCPILSFFQRTQTRECLVPVHLANGIVRYRSSMPAEFVVYLQNPTQDASPGVAAQI